MITAHPGWTCGVCTAPIAAVVRKRDDDQDVYLPASNYWRGTSLRVDVAYCSAQCSLAHHEGEWA